MSLPSQKWQRNPYAVSPAVLANAQPLAQLALASRPVCLAAHLIDGLILSAALVPAAIGLWLDVSEHLRPNYTMTGGVLTLAVGTAWAAYNLHLLSRNGQSIGKRLLSIKFVRRDGSPLPGTHLQAAQRRQRLTPAHPARRRAVCPPRRPDGLQPDTAVPARPDRRHARGQGPAQVSTPNPCGRPSWVRDEPCAEGART
jgi:hypothetical protein